MVPAAVRGNRLPGTSVAVAVTYTAAVGITEWVTTACSVELAVVGSRRRNSNAAEVILLGTRDIGAAIAVGLFNTAVADFPVDLGSLGGRDKGKDNGDGELHDFLIDVGENV